MKEKEFLNRIEKFSRSFAAILQDKNNNWIIKGFIDHQKNIYPIPNDTKIISKLIEIVITPLLYQFAENNNLQVILSKEQNHYPDFTFIDTQTRKKYALDIKSTYRIHDKINGFTLGAYTGYFANRKSSKNTTYPYGEYSLHLVLGIIYERGIASENTIHTLDDLENIPSIIKNLTFFVKEKWRIASDKPGSGNTKNIGSIKNIADILAGQGVFSAYGESVFDDYWIHFGSSYKNIDEYIKRIDRLSQSIYPSAKKE